MMVDSTEHDFASYILDVGYMYTCTNQGPWVGDQGPNLEGQWVVTQGPGGHWMMGQTHDVRHRLL